MEQKHFFQPTILVIFDNKKNGNYLHDHINGKKNEGRLKF